MKEFIRHFRTSHFPVLVSRNSLPLASCPGQEEEEVEEEVQEEVQLLHPPHPTAAFTQNQQGTDDLHTSRKVFVCQIISLQHLHDFSCQTWVKWCDMKYVSHNKCTYVTKVQVKLYCIYTGIICWIQVDCLSFCIILDNY